MEREGRQEIKLSQSQKRRQRRLEKKKNGPYIYVKHEAPGEVHDVQGPVIQTEDVFPGLGTAVEIDQPSRITYFVKTPYAVAQEQRAALISQAVHSLYLDGIKPRISEVCCRVKEIIKKHQLNEFLLVKKSHIRSIANTTQKFVVEDEIVSKETFCFLTVTPDGFQGFVDPKDTNDPYSKPVWKNVLLYISSLLANKNGECPSVDDNLRKHQFKIGRYGLASVLAQLPAFSKMRLGEICHLIQLGISKSVLAFENSVLQPLAACEDRTADHIRNLEMRTAEKAALLNTLIAHINKILALERQGVEFAELFCVLVSEHQINLKPEILGISKIMDVFSLPEMDPHFRLFSFENGKTIFIQSKIYSLPMDGILITVNPLKAAEPHVSTELWAPVQHMLQISYFFEKHMSNNLFAPLPPSISEEIFEPSLIPEDMRTTSWMMSPKSAPVFPDLCIDEFGIVEFDFTVQDQNDLADEILMEEDGDLYIREFEIHSPGGMEVEDLDRDYLFFSAAELLNLENPSEMCLSDDMNVENFVLFQDMQKEDFLLYLSLLQDDH